MKLPRRAFVMVFVCVLILISLSCKRSIPGGGDFVKSSPPVALKFSITIDKEICQQNKFKRTPQFAVWLEQPETGEIRTVCITQKTAKGEWGGTTTRPVSLPYWVSRWNKETETAGDPTAENPAADAVTSATPQEEFTKTIEVPSGSKWDYYVEVNVSGDHNEHFGANSPDGKRDKHSNGQPSIIYKGTITADDGNTSKPELIGRTDQFTVKHELIADLEGITTAKQLFSQLEVACTPCQTAAN